MSLGIPGNQGVAAMPSCCKHTCVFEPHTRVFKSIATRVPYQQHVGHIQKMHKPYRQIREGWFAAREVLLIQESLVVKL